MEDWKTASIQFGEEDLYLKMKELERELDFLTMQEEAIKEEQRHLKSEYIRSKEEVSFPLSHVLDQTHLSSLPRYFKFCGNGG
jgi:hypothetical protein